MEVQKEKKINKYMHIHFLRWTTFIHPKEFTMLKPLTFQSRIPLTILAAVLKPLNLIDFEWGTWGISPKSNVVINYRLNSSLIYNL